MRDERFVENFKIMIEMIINLNDKLCEQTLKKRYSKPRQQRDENYINHRTYEKKTKTSQNQKHSNETIFMKLNVILFKKFKNKEKKQLKKRRVTHVIKKIIMLKITNRKMLFDDNSTFY